MYINRYKLGKLELNLANFFCQKNYKKGYGTIFKTTGQASKDFNIPIMKKEFLACKFARQYLSIFCQS